MAVITITKDNYEEEVIKSSVPVLLDFSAIWCGPCRMLAPILDDLANDVEGKAKVGKIDVDEQLELAREFGVMSVPTLVVMKNGEEASREIGVRSKQDILEMLN